MAHIMQYYMINNLNKQERKINQMKTKSIKTELSKFEYISFAGIAVLLVTVAVGFIIK